MLTVSENSFNEIEFIFLPSENSPNYSKRKLSKLTKINKNYFLKNGKVHKIFETAEKTAKTNCFSKHTVIDEESNDKQIEFKDMNNFYIEKFAFQQKITFDFLSKSVLNLKEIKFRKNTSKLEINRFNKNGNSEWKLKAKSK